MGDNDNASWKHLRHLMRFLCKWHVKKTWGKKNRISWYKEISR